MCVPRSVDLSTTRPIKSRLKSVVGSVLPTSNEIIIEKLHEIRVLMFRALALLSKRRLPHYNDKKKSGKKIWKLEMVDTITAR